MRAAKVTLGGKRWTIAFVPPSRLPKDWIGRCQWDEKKIQIAKNLPRRELVETLIHEAAHAHNPLFYEAESFVDQFASEITECLFRTGLLHDGDA